MTTYLTAMASALTVHAACARQIENCQSIDNFNIDSIVADAMRKAAALPPCTDEVIEGMAKAIQAQSRCTAIAAFRHALGLLNPALPLGYSRWRHGGWYVHGVRYPSGACGCVSSNYPDRRWRIACERRRPDLNAPGDVTFRSREAAARAEQALALQAWVESVR